MDHIEMARMGGNAIKRQIRQGKKPKSYYSDIRKKRKSYPKRKKKAIHRASLTTASR
jgi:hypothetical protein